jgi:hypothetical protein
VLAALGSSPKPGVAGSSPVAPAGTNRRNPASTVGFRLFSSPRAFPLTSAGICPPGEVSFPHFPASTPGPHDRRSRRQLAIHFKWGPSREAVPFTLQAPGAGRRSERRLCGLSPMARPADINRRTGAVTAPVAVRDMSRRAMSLGMCERVFVTSEGHPGARFQRALAAGNLTAAEQAAFELPFIPLADARALVELYAEKGDRRYERAALKTSAATWTRRARRSPTLPRSPACSPSAT